MTVSDSALVLLSGGQDSTTSLYWALNRFNAVSALTVSYGQVHSCELESARLVAEKAGVDHEMINVDLFSTAGVSSLIKGGQPTGHEGLPDTFVPGRNLVFLMYAGVYAYKLGVHDLVIGVSQVDYSGYPDCRKPAIEAMEKTLSLGMDFPVQIHTPLIERSKADIVKLAVELGAYEMMKYTHTCYRGSRPPCGECDACRLRAKGFEEAGLPDPLVQGKK